MLTTYRTGVDFRDGQMFISGRKDFMRAVTLMPAGPGELIIRPSSRSRTLRQNAYWWAVVIPALADHCGYTANQMHYALLGECFGYLDGPRGVPVPVQPSSSTLTVEQFTHLIEWVLTWAPTELGVEIQAPGEDAYDEFTFYDR